MKLTTRLLVTALVTALAVPAVGFAAKGEKKKDKKDGAALTFTAVDKNSDGTVTQGEYIAAMKETLGETGAKTQFASLDKNSDNKLSKEEFEATGGQEKKKRGKKKNQN